MMMVIIIFGSKMIIMTIEHLDVCLMAYNTGHPMVKDEIRHNIAKAIVGVS